MSAGGGSPTSYSTLFPGTENPISESGKWVCGGTTGLDWNNPRTTPGKCFASAIVSTVDDDIACLSTTFGPNQFAQATAFRQVGYTAPDSHESEVLLRFKITAHSARGYEIVWTFDGAMAIVRWNGALNDFDVLFGPTNINAAVTGDVFRAEMNGATITVYKNGVSVGTVDDSTYTDGQPGVGFFPRTGATPESYCWSAFSGGEL